jgi:hypothetical protein
MCTQVQWYWSSSAHLLYGSTGSWVLAAGLCAENALFMVLEYFVLRVLGTVVLLSCDGGSMVQVLLYQVLLLPCTVSGTQHDILLIPNVSGVLCVCKSYKV